MNDIEKIIGDLDTVKSKIKDALMSAGQVTGIALVVVGIIGLVYEAYVITKLRQIKSWSVTKGKAKIISSHMETYTKPNSYSLFLISSTYYTFYYRTRIAFEYSMNDKTYISYKCTYNESWSHNPAEAKAYLEKYKAGETVDVLINPSNPGEAYLYTHDFSDYEYIALSLGMIAAGMMIIRKT